MLLGKPAGAYMRRAGPGKEMVYLEDRGIRWEGMPRRFAGLETGSRHVKLGGHYNGSGGFYQRNQRL